MRGGWLFFWNNMYYFLRFIFFIIMQIGDIFRGGGLIEGRDYWGWGIIFFVNIKQILEIIISLFLVSNISKGKV